MNNLLLFFRGGSLGSSGHPFRELIMGVIIIILAVVFIKYNNGDFK